MEKKKTTLVPPMVEKENQIRKMEGEEEPQDD